MPLQLQTSIVIDRPVAKVFHFYAVEHVRNHPRWDPDIDLWMDDGDTIQVGTVIHRRNRRYGTPVEEIMEVVEFVPNRVFAAVIQDSPMPMRGRTTFEAVNDSQTRLTTDVEFSWMDESDDKSFLISRLERSGRNQKQLMESEI